MENKKVLNYDEEVEVFLDILRGILQRSSYSQKDKDIWELRIKDAIIDFLYATTPEQKDFAGKIALYKLRLMITEALLKDAVDEGDGVYSFRFRYDTHKTTPDNFIKYLINVSRYENCKTRKKIDEYRTDCEFRQL